MGRVGGPSGELVVDKGEEGNLTLLSSGSVYNWFHSELVLSLV